MNWISVKERMPKEGELVLCFPHGTTGKSFIGFLEENFDEPEGTLMFKEEDSCCAFFQQDVTHWQPLPELPKD